MPTPADDDLERASEVDDVTDSLRRRPTGVDDDAIVGEIDTRRRRPALLAERDQYKDIAQRLQADFDNYRKRVATQQSPPRPIGRRAGSPRRCCRCSMPPRRRSLRHPDEVGPLLNQMLASCKKHGLETLDLDGPAVRSRARRGRAHEPGDGGEPVVAEVLRSGYPGRARSCARRWSRPRTDSQGSDPDADGDE